MPANRGKRVSEAEFRRMWDDLSIPVAQIGARLGISQQAVTQRAKARGLPRRRPRGGQPVVDEAQFRKLYAAGVAMTEIARLMGFDRKTAHNTVARLGLPRRGSGGPKQWLTLADYRAMQLREAMATSARETEAALRLAEMVDGWRDPRCLSGKRAA